VLSVPEDDSYIGDDVSALWNKVFLRDQFKNNFTLGVYNYSACRYLGYLGKISILFLLEGRDKRYLCEVIEKEMQGFFVVVLKIALQETPITEVCK
jgi:hypothetical protein